MTREAILRAIRALARGSPGLFRVHRTHPALYARARRTFGSWSAAVRAAALDYAFALQRARARSSRTRRRRARGRVRDGRGDSGNVFTPW